jgi:cation diffusion facilitator family transporter
MVANVALAAVKVSAGIVGRSNAVVADGVHSLSDLSTDLAVLIGARYWSQPPDEDHPHGHRRIEAVVTIFIGLFLGGVAVGLVYDALAELGAARKSPPGWIAFGAAALSIVAKEIVYHWTCREGKKAGSNVVMANAWHHRSDAFSSIPVALAVGVAAVEPSLWYIDQVGGVVVGLVIIVTAWKIVAPEVGKLIDRAAPEDTVRRIIDIAKATPGVRDAHAVRTRYQGSQIAVDLHITVDPEWTVRKGHEVSERARERILDDGPDVGDVVVHLEPDGELESQEFPRVDGITRPHDKKPRHKC